MVVTSNSVKTVTSSLMLSQHGSWRQHCWRQLPSEPSLMIRDASFPLNIILDADASFPLTPSVTAYPSRIDKGTLFTSHKDIIGAEFKWVGALLRFWETTCFPCSRCGCGKVLCPNLVFIFICQNALCIWKTGKRSACQPRPRGLGWHPVWWHQ